MKELEIHCGICNKSCGNCNKSCSICNKWNSVAFAMNKSRANPVEFAINIVKHIRALTLCCFSFPLQQFAHTSNSPYGSHGNNFFESFHAAIECACCMPCSRAWKNEQLCCQAFCMNPSISWDIQFSVTFFSYSGAICSTISVWLMAMNGPVQ